MDEIPVPGTYQGNSRLDSRRSSVSSLASSSWANNTTAGTTAPSISGGSGRRGRLLYTPMIVVDGAESSQQAMWADGSSNMPSLPSSARPGWYPGAQAGTGPPSQARTYTSVRMPASSQSFVEKGSADSLVESVSGDCCHWTRWFSCLRNIKSGPRFWSRIRALCYFMVRYDNIIFTI